MEAGPDVCLQVFDNVSGLQTFVYKVCREALVSQLNSLELFSRPIRAPGER